MGRACGARRSPGGQWDERLLFVGGCDGQKVLKTGNYPSKDVGVWASNKISHLTFGTADGKHVSFPSPHVCACLSSLKQLECRPKP